MKAIILVLSLFVSTASAFEIESVKIPSCTDVGGELTSEPFMLAQLAPQHPGVSCICAGQVGHLGRIAAGEIFCSTAGWAPNYPIVNLEACPYRVNRFRPPPNGCGSRGMQRWLPQKFLFAR